MKRTVIVRRDYLHYIPKYNRYEKRHRNIPAHVSPCFRVKTGDQVIIGQCRYNFQKMGLKLFLCVLKKHDIFERIIDLFLKQWDSMYSKLTQSKKQVELQAKKHSVTTNRKKKRNWDCFFVEFPLIIIQQTHISWKKNLNYFTRENCPVILFFIIYSQNWSFKKIILKTQKLLCVFNN